MSTPTPLARASAARAPAPTRPRLPVGASAPARCGPLSPHPRARASSPPPAAQLTGQDLEILRAPATVDAGEEESVAPGPSRPALPPTRAPSTSSSSTSLLSVSALTLAALTIPGLAGFDFDKPASIAQALGVLAAIVAVHEAGHFSCARALGVRVSQFAIGFGPALLSRTGGDGVEYSLRAIPLGGYVAFPDDDPETDVAPDDPDLLKNRPLLERAAVLSAGDAANLVAAACGL